MATNDVHLSVSDNNVSVPLTVSGSRSLRSVTPQNGSPYYVGARAYVTQNEDGATVTVIDKDGTTTADLYNGTDGTDGIGIADISQTSTSGNVDTYTITYSNGDATTFNVTNGIDGVDGVDGVDGTDGVDGYSPSATVSKVGTTATITITDKDGTTTAEVYDGSSGGASAFVAEFNVTTYADVKDAYDNDAIIICTADDSGNTIILQLAYYDDANSIFYFAEPNGDGWIWTSIASDDTWDDGVMQFASTDTATQLRDGLMTALDKQKLDTIASGAEVNVQSDWSQGDNTKDDFIKNKPTIPTVNNATLTIQKNSTNVATFTANASSNVTANISVPTDTGDLTNGAGFITGYTETDPVFSASAASGITSSDISDWNSKSEVSVTRHTTSGTNIADLTIDGTTTKLYAPTGGGGTITDVEVDGVSVVTGGVAEIDLTGKQDELVSGVSIRTINGTSVLGSGDIEVAAGGTPIPTADTVAEFDASAHMNSTDMTSQEVSDFVDNLDASGTNHGAFILATFTANNQTVAFAEPLSNFSMVSVNAYVVDSNGEYLLNSVEFFPQHHIPQRAIVCFNDGTLRKFQVALSDTQGTNNYFTAVNKAEIIGYR